MMFTTCIGPGCGRTLRPKDVSKASAPDTFSRTTTNVCTRCYSAGVREQRAGRYDLGPKGLRAELPPAPPEPLTPQEEAVRRLILRACPPQGRDQVLEMLVGSRP